MDQNLVYEAWIISWSHAFNVHKTGKGQTCNLQELKLNIPTETHDILFEQRLLVENATFLLACINKEVWNTPCKKNVCKAAHTAHDIDGMSGFWVKLVLRAFSRTTDVSYIVQSKEDWLVVINLLTKAMSILIQMTKKQLKHTKISLSGIVSNCVQILEYEIFRSTDLNVIELLKAVSPQPKFSEIPIAILQKLAKVLVVLFGNSGNISELMKADVINNQIQIIMAQNLFEFWRVKGVTGTACAEKLIQALGASRATNSVILGAIKELALTGNAPSLARTQSVMDLLKLIAESELESYEERYNATLLLTELFPRHAWEVINILIPHLRSAREFCPFVLTAFALHDVPRMLSLIPETNDLLCQTDVCIALVAAKASECAAAEIIGITTYAENALANLQSVSLSWIALLLAIVVGSDRPLKEESLTVISQILKSQEVDIVVSLIRYWSVAVARHFNQGLRDEEIELSILSSGPCIEYPPNPGNPLLAVALECCDRWRDRAPLAIKALEERLLHKTESSVFESTSISPVEICRNEKVPDQWYQTDVSDISDLTEFISSFKTHYENKTLSPFNDQDIISVGQSFKKLYSAWSYILHSQSAEKTRRVENWSENCLFENRRVEIFESYVDSVTSAYTSGMMRICEVLSDLGNSIDSDLALSESIYSSLDEYSQLQRFLETTIRICTECIYRPLQNHKSLLNHLWFDRQLCPLLHTTGYVFKATLWFYSDSRSPLPLRLGLAQVYGQFMEYTPKAFKSAQLPRAPLDNLLKTIRTNHAQVVKQLGMRDVVEVSAMTDGEKKSVVKGDAASHTEERDYARDVADFIVSAIG